VLKECEGKVAVAADRLELPRASLYRMLKKLSDSPDEPTGHI
jgi:transcriptional regulator of acetoin/glycerol metabolism